MSILDIIQQKTFIIAEVGINHDGNINKAKMMIESAAKAGADAVKFQTHLPEKEMLKAGPTADHIGGSLFKILKKVELSKAQHELLKNYAEEKGIMFLSTPFSREAADLLEELDVPAYKIGSGEMTNLPLLEYIAKKQKPMLISTGMSCTEEVRETVEFIKPINQQMILLYCVSTYPTEYKDLNLNVIGVFKKEFGLPVGLSDHSVGIYTALAGVALGAKVIEKHFTISRKWPGPDQTASIEPDELKELVLGVRAIEQVLGNEKKVTAKEEAIQQMARESVVSLADIPKDTVITPEMVWVKRPGTGIPAKDLPKVIGAKARQDIQADQLISWRQIEIK